MMLNKDVELLDGLPIAYIRSLDALVLSDLHLGYESHMAKKGVFIPKANLKKILGELEVALRIKKARRIIVVGDIKNDFSTVGDDEFNELYEIIQLCKKKRVELTLIKGNHDNFIDRYKESFKIKVFSNEARIEGYLFFHGDKVPKITGNKPRMLISGHEHPSIGIVKSIGRTEKLRCFLSGTYKGIDLLILPAISYFAVGSDINLQGKERLLSPIFRNIDVDSMHAIALGYGSTIDFGSIGNLRKLGYR
jgi:putative SbcD/Mre11-related phosphoesterase